MIETIKAGLDWLYRTEQPADAILQHHGIQHLDGGVVFSFAPRGWNGGPVVAAWPARPLSDPEDIPALTPAETREIAGLLAAAGARISQQWKGGIHHRAAACFGLAEPAIESLRRAVGNYAAGCPEHARVLCDWEPPHGQNCAWYRTGYALVVMPRWPEYADAGT